MHQKSIRLSSTVILKVAVVIIGLIVTGLCVFVLPLLISLDQTGFYQPLLYAMYVTTVPFFFALYQAIKLLNFIEKNQAFTSGSVRVLKKVKYAAAVICGFYMMSLPYVFYVAGRNERPGVVVIAVVVVFASFVIAVASAVFERLFQNAVDIKAENDLTV